MDSVGISRCLDLLDELQHPLEWCSIGNKLLIKALDLAPTSHHFAGPLRSVHVLQAGPVTSMEERRATRLRRGICATRKRTVLRCMSLQVAHSLRGPPSECPPCAETRPCRKAISVPPCPTLGGVAARRPAPPPRRGPPSLCYLRHGAASDAVAGIGARADQ